jgi:hypothetical protein
MSIQKKIILRYRSAGHLRFELPPQLCTDTAAPLVEEAISRIDGVYRVTLYRRQRKLSIRFFDTVCEVPEVARQMHYILGEMAEKGLLKPGAKTIQHKKGGIKEKLATSHPVAWFLEKYQEGKETVTAVKILAGKPIKNAPAFLQNPEKAAIEFCTDILTFYLIKTHWQRILHQWLPHPLKHRYEWLALSYLTFLWVRSRHKKD